MKKLVNQRTGRQHPITRSIEFVEFNSEGRGVAVHDDPQIGRSCIIDRGNHGYFGWHTSVIAEIISPTEFKTQNTHYKIEKYESDEEE